MEQLKASTQQLKDHVGEYVSTYAQIMKAKATQGASNAAATGAVVFAAALLSLFFLLFVFAGLALWFGTMVNSYAAGFFIVAGIFALLTVGLFALRKKYIVPVIRNAVVAGIYEQKNPPHAADKN